MKPEKLSEWGQLFPFFQANCPGFFPVLQMGISCPSPRGGLLAVGESGKV